jgi:peptidyl-tRNA hydrolase, PTH2 family
MNAGKVAAQASHACMKIFFDKMNVSKIDGSPYHQCSFTISDEELQWIEGKFTKITKKVKNENQLLKVYNQAIEAGLNASLIKDAGLYGLEGENYTCVAIGPNYVDKCEPVVGKLQLLTDLKNHETKE